jgi:hypothetical protein
MDSVRLTVLGVLTRHDPEAIGRIEVVPAHTPNFIAALARKGQEPDDCSKWIAHLLGCGEHRRELLVAQGAMPRLLARWRCNA